MTYNFDPDRWYENELAAIEKKYRQGRISKREMEVQMQALDQRYNDMWERLDGSYQLPSP
jgi:hypothetical protein